MHSYSPDNSHLKARSARFVQRMFAMRLLGTVLCFLPVLSVLQELHCNDFFYLPLFINAFIWPWIARYLALSSADPTHSERRNLKLDAAFAGFWIATIDLSPIPSIIIMAVLASDFYAVGGWSQLRGTAQLFVLTAIPVWLFNGAHLQLDFSARTVWLTLPLAAGYMFALSAVSYQLTLTLRRKNRELGKLSLMDPSLEIPNRRLFDQQLESEYFHSKRGECRAWLLLLDIDNFKTVNDTFGHEMGDFLLVEISAQLRHKAHPQDTPARFGGDELGMIVHDADDVGILTLATALQQQISQLRLPVAEPFRCSVSIGVAAALDADNPQQWLNHADQALYRVKRAGRDGVQLWQPLPEQNAEKPTQTYDR